MAITDSWFKNSEENEKLDEKSDSLASKFEQAENTSLVKEIKDVTRLLWAKIKSAAHKVKEKAADFFDYPEETAADNNGPSVDDDL